MAVFYVVLLTCLAVQSTSCSPLLSLGSAHDEHIVLRGMKVGKRASSDPADVVGVTAAQLDDFKRYAQWAGASYCGPVAGAPVFCQGDICPAGGAANVTFSDVFYGFITDILAFLAVSPATSEIIVSVRGTSGLVNWLDNILFQLEPTTLCSGCEAHLGFLTAYTEIVGAIQSSLVKTMALYPHYKITITGHSLGAAVATLLACHFRDSLRGALMSNKNMGGVSLYTYGSPRVGNLALVTYMTQQQSGRPSGGNWRITHHHDVVPRLPPVIEDYRHVSPEYWLAAGPNDRTTYTPGEVDECDGYASSGCNAGAPWWDIDVESHSYYLVGISHCGLNITHGQVQGPACGNGTANGSIMGPVNGTTATSSTNTTGDGGLTPETVNTLAMFAKLDQEYMGALAASGGTGATAGF